jgi:hypothetical protein
MSSPLVMSLLLALWLKAIRRHRHRRRHNQWQQDTDRCHLYESDAADGRHSYWISVVTYG